MQRHAPSTSASHVTERAQAKSGALVLGGAHGALALARSLGRHGIPVWFLTNDHPLARYSRYVERSLTWRGPQDAGALDFLLQLAAREGLGGWTLFACADPEVRLLGQNHAVLSAAFRVAVPSWDVIRWSVDKRMTHQFATQAGVDSPWSYYPRDRQDVVRLDCQFPLIVKPTVREQRNAFTQAKAWRADDRAALLARYGEAAALVGEHQIVLQELIPGNGQEQFSFAALCDRGMPVASLTARRRRQFPIDFGYTSTLVETIEQPEVEAAASRLLRALNFTGLVEVEFKHDIRDGRYKLLDINARPWTWISLGAAAGVDFPYLAWRLAQGEALSPKRAKAGVRWLHVSRDIAAIGQEMLAGSGSFRDFVSPLRRPTTFATFAADDPLPALIELPIVARRLLSRFSVARRGAVKTPAVSPRPTT